MTMMCGFMASRVSTVSFRVSPFFRLDIDELKLIRSALRRLAAISNELRVRVEFSKNRLTTVLPFRAGTFLTSRLETSMKASAVSRMVSMSSTLSCSMPSRWSWRKVFSFI